MNASVRASKHAWAPAKVPDFEAWVSDLSDKLTPREMMDAEAQAFQQFFGRPVDVQVYPVSAVLHITCEYGSLLLDFRRDWDMENDMRAAAAYLLMVMRVRNDASLFFNAGL